MSSPIPHQPERGTRSAPRAPHSFFYDRVIPMIVAGLAVVLLIILVLTIGALAGVIPAR
jgi:hypothetical protein